VPNCSAIAETNQAVECRSVAGIGLCLNDINESDVYLLDWSSQICIDDCEDTVFYIGPVAGSIFLRDCKRCR
jgi:protein XRP2